MRRTTEALANVALLEEARRKAIDAVRVAAIADAAKLRKLAPDIYEIALCLENDGDFYRKCVLPLIAEIAREPADTNTQWTWERWQRVARYGLHFYGRDYAGLSWSPLEGTRELLAAYFATVKYAEEIRDKRAEIEAAGESQLNVYNILKDAGLR